MNRINRAYAPGFVVNALSVGRRKGQIEAIERHSLAAGPWDWRWRDGRIAAPPPEDQPLKVIVMSRLLAAVAS